jgi:IS1 family transposase
MVTMRTITPSQRTQVVRCLVEGNSVRSTVRITGLAKNTIVRLLGELGCACAGYHNKHLRNLKVRRMQCDEVWSFVGAKAKNVSVEKKQEGWGDVWTWTAIDADTKLCVSYLVGGRDGGWAKDFMEDCAKRIRNRVQITTDGHKAYLEAVENAFGADIDYAQLYKVYGAPSDEETRRYSPAQCVGCNLKVVSGNPDPAHVSTTYVERSNLTSRTGNRRFTRLTYGFSKRIDNHRHMVALFFFYYNFCRIHSTLRVTPAMEAGLTDHAWSLEEMCATLPAQTPSAKRAERSMTLKALGEASTVA